MTKVQCNALLVAPQPQNMLKTEQNVIVLPAPSVQVGIVCLDRNKISLSRQQKPGTRAQSVDKISAAKLMTNCRAIPKGKVQHGCSHQAGCKVIHHGKRGKYL